MFCKLVVVVMVATAQEKDQLVFVSGNMGKSLLLLLLFLFVRYLPSPLLLQYGTAARSA